MILFLLIYCSHVSSPIDGKRTWSINPFEVRYGFIELLSEIRDTIVND